MLWVWKSGFNSWNQISENVLSLFGALYIGMLKFPRAAEQGGLGGDRPPNTCSGGLFCTLCTTFGSMQVLQPPPPPPPPISYCFLCHCKFLPEIWTSIKNSVQCYTRQFFPPIFPAGHETNAPCDPAVLFKAVTLLVQILYTTIYAYAPLP